MTTPRYIKDMPLAKKASEAQRRRLMMESFEKDAAVVEQSETQRAAVDHAHELLKRLGYHRDGDHFVNVNRVGVEAMHVSTIATIAHAALLSAAPRPPEEAQELRPAAWPKDAAEVRDFFNSDFIRAEFVAPDQAPCDEDRYYISAHDFLSAVNWWADFPNHPTPQQAAPAAVAVGDATLWCVHIQGPDDLHATPSKAEALDKANELNTFFGTVPYEEGDPIMRAVAIEWPYSADEHAAWLHKRSIADAARAQAASGQPRA